MRYITYYAIARGAVAAVIAWAMLAVVVLVFQRELERESPFFGLLWGDIAAVPAIVVALAIGVLEARMTIRRLRPKDDDAAKCRKCGHTLVGLPEGRCPGCGTPFVDHAGIPGERDGK